MASPHPNEAIHAQQQPNNSSYKYLYRRRVSWEHLLNNAPVAVRHAPNNPSMIFCGFLHPTHLAHIPMEPFMPSNSQTTAHIRNYTVDVCREHLLNTAPVAVRHAPSIPSMILCGFLHATWLAHIPMKPFMPSNSQTTVPISIYTVDVCLGNIY